MAVAWGLTHRDLSTVTAIGIDEIARRKGHKYVTLVYQIDAGYRRLLWVGKNRTAKTLRHFFRQFGTERTARLRFICSDKSGIAFPEEPKKKGAASSKRGGAL